MSRRPGKALAPLLKLMRVQARTTSAASDPDSTRRKRRPGSSRDVVQLAPGSRQLPLPYPAVSGTGCSIGTSRRIGRWTNSTYDDSFRTSINMVVS